MVEERPQRHGNDDVPAPEEFVAATERAFGMCPKRSGLQLLTAEARNGFLTAQFEGPATDFGGPYGVIIQLPTSKKDSLWVEHASLEGNVDVWAHSAVAMRALKAYTTSRDENRRYTPDNVWWLINDTQRQKRHKDLTEF